MTPSLQSNARPPCDLGIVVIGRNEGDRLKRCLHSIGQAAGPIVYVDSGSSDQSVALARQVNAAVVELDPAQPFTAAAARNAGLRRLVEMHPDIRLVQFVDGDCELAANWLSEACQYLHEREDVAVICGRRRERFIDASIYNRLCDMEWDVATGEVPACGGDAMMRIAPLVQVGGFRASMIAGEEPELCVRLRKRNWKILRVDSEMTLHDAAIVHLSQWWRRTMRAGHAYAEAAWLHHGTRELRQAGSIVLWAMILPVLAIALAWMTRGVSVALLPLGYVVLWLRVYVMQRKRRESSDAALYATSVVIGKSAQWCGMARYITAKLLRRQGRIIEYKSSQTLSPALANVP